MRLFHFGLLIITTLFVIISFFGCDKDETSNAPSTRTYKMGFQNSAPKLDIALYTQSLNLWTQRADAAIISIDLPWNAIYNGETAEHYVNNNFKGLVDVYRSKGLELWVYIDPANGLNRATDAQALVSKGKSISQSEVQKIYRGFVFVTDSILKPEHFGLALETNLIRSASPDSIYQGIKKVANAAAEDIRAYDKNVKLSISIQVDWAWGKSQNVPYIGVDKDFADFPFIQELGLSSYPYFVFENPQDIPINYYSKITEGRSIPVFVSEGGWSSEKVGTYNESLQKQQDYIIKQGQLLDNAKGIAFFQLIFTDIDASALPPDIPPIINLFIHTGLVDINLNPKPSLTEWDNIFKKKYVK